MTLRPAIVCKEFAMASALGSMAFGRWMWLLGAFPLAAAEDVLNVLFMATWMVWDSRAVLGLWFECCAWKPGEGDDKDQIGTYFNQPIISSLVWGMEQPKSSFWATKQFIGGSIEGQIPTFAAKRSLSLVSRVTWVISPSSSVHFLAVKMQVVGDYNHYARQWNTAWHVFFSNLGMIDPKWHQGRHRSQPKSCRWPDNAIPHGKMCLWGRIQPLWRRVTRVALEKSGKPCRNLPILMGLWQLL